MKVRSSLGGTATCLEWDGGGGDVSVPLGPKPSTANGSAWTRWRPPILALLLLPAAAGCAVGRRDPPLQVMTAVAHEQAAEVEDQRAVQAGQVSASEGGALNAEAVRHRQAAEALRRAATEACPAPALESDGVFSLVTAVILDVQPLEERMSTGPPRPSRAGPPARTAGAVIRLSTRLPVEDAAAGLECQVARARVNGGSAADPLAVPGVLRRVSSPAPGILLVELHSDDAAVALEVLRRARALAAH